MVTTLVTGFFVWRFTRPIKELSAAARKVAGDEHPEILYNLGSTYAVLNPPRKTEAIQLLKSFSVRACRGAGRCR